MVAADRLRRIEGQGAAVLPLGLRLAPELEQAAGGVGDRHGVEVVLLLRALEEIEGGLGAARLPQAEAGEAQRREVVGVLLDDRLELRQRLVAVPLLDGLGDAVEVLGDAGHGARIGQSRPVTGPEAAPPR